MEFLRKLILAATLGVLLPGIASADAITLYLESVTAVGGSFPTSQTYVPALPLEGSGELNLLAGTGTLSLPSYAVILDVSIDGTLDAQLDITGWTQTISSIDGAGNITSTGSGTVACTVLGGLGSVVCPGVAPNVVGWPPTGAGSFAVIDEIDGTITVADASQAALAGTITQVFSYSIVPEPSDGLMMFGSLFALGLMARRLRS